MGQRGKVCNAMRVIDPLGNITDWTEGAPAWCRANPDVNPRVDRVYDVLAGRRGSHRGYRFFKLDERGEPVAASKPVQDPNERVRPAPKPDDVARGGDALTLEKRKQVLVESLQALTDQTRLIAAGVKEAPNNWNPERILKVYAQEAKAYGLDLDQLMDARSDTDRLMDAVDAILTSPDEVFAQTDEAIGQLEEAFKQAASLSLDYFRERGVADPNGYRQSAQRWLARLARVKELRNLVREPWTDTVSTKERRAYEATRTLRYLLYVGRDEKGAIYNLGKHMVKMCCDTWIAEIQGSWDYDGPVKPGELIGPAPITGQKDRREVWRGSECDGLMLMYPPRHTKTTFLKFWTGERISRDPYEQGCYLHDKEEEAMLFLKNVAGLFTRDTDSGRRNLSLYQVALADFDNRSNSIRLKVSDPPKNPNLKACGIHSSALGNNFTFLLADDVVPQSDQVSETERERRKSKFRGTWLTRFIGGKGFYILSGYPWHHDDLVWETYMLAKRGAETNWQSGQRLAVSKMAVGGPQNRFRPIWPDVFSASVLKRLFQKINDRGIWAANFELNPITDDLRIVKKVRLYDPSPEDDPEQHERFVAGAVIHLSVDPSATAREKSDKTGYVKAAIGELQFYENVADVRIVSTRTVIRVLEAREFHATTMEVVDRIGEACAAQKIDCVHVEVVQAFGAIVEMLENHGINTVAHRPGQKSKERRLRTASPMLEDGAEGLRAVVEFAGVRGPDGKLEPREDMKHLIDYVVNFRVTTGHHSLDALTQLCNHLAPQVGVGMGESVSMAGGFPGKKPKSRLELLYERAELERKDMERPDGLLRFAEGTMA